MILALVEVERSTKNVMEHKNKKKILTLCIVHQHPKILLGKKKRGFGEGRWNGFGGKVEENETIEEGMRREIKEEAGIDVNDLNKHGILEFRFESSPETLEVHIFKSKDFLGDPIESEEMIPGWFHIDEIPFGEMWPSDLHWFPLFLKDKKFKGRFFLDKPSTSDYASVVIDKEIEIVDII